MTETIYLIMEQDDEGIRPYNEIIIFSKEEAEHIKGTLTTVRSDKIYTISSFIKI